MSGNNPSPQEIIQQGYRVAAHAHAAGLALAIGDRVYLTDYVYRDGQRYTNRMSGPLPAGYLATGVTPSFYSEWAEFRGINEAGDFVVRYGGREYRVPYTFVSQRQETVAVHSRVTLNNNHTAEVHSNGQTVRVGCQTISADAVRRVVAQLDAATAAAAAAATTRAVHVATANPTATYQAKQPRAAKKAVTKAPAKKVATKKAAKKVARARSVLR